ncbi:MAG: hypothetical protein J0H17_09345 [Rhizobiales bacterium]|nr:hypothetical protein [Hyphomicrobiales bacterium]
MLIPVDIPDALPVTVADARTYCRAPGEEDNAVIERAVRSAIEYVQDYASVTLGRSIWHQTFPSWRSCLEIETSPVRDVLSIGYVDDQGADQVVDPSQYRTTITPTGAVVRFTSAFSSPATNADEDLPITVEFAAGYDLPGETGSGDDPRLKLPARAETAVLYLTRLFYDHRTAESPEQLFPIETVTNLLHQLKVYR